MTHMTYRFQDGRNSNGDSADRDASNGDIRVAHLTTLIDALRAEDLPTAQSALTALAGLPGSAMQRIWDTASPEALAVVCRALDMRRPLFGALYARLHGSQPYQDFARTSQFRRALIQFNRLHASQASRILHTWRRAPATVWHEPGGGVTAAAE